MLESNEHAYVCGRKAAMIWKRLKRVVSTWDLRCMAWAEKHKLPAWIVHVPVVIAVLGSLAGILLGGALIACCLIFIWAIMFIVQHIGQPTKVHITNWDKNSLWRERDDKNTRDGVFEPYDPEPYIYDEYNNRN